MRTRGARARRVASRAGGPPAHTTRHFSTSPSRSTSLTISRLSLLPLLLHALLSLVMATAKEQLLATYKAYACALELLRC